MQRMLVAAKIERAAKHRHILEPMENVPMLHSFEEWHLFEHNLHTWLKENQLWSLLGGPGTLTFEKSKRQEMEGRACALIREKLCAEALEVAEEATTVYSMLAVLENKYKPGSTHLFRMFEYLHELSLKEGDDMEEYLRCYTFAEQRSADVLGFQFDHSILILSLLHGLNASWELFRQDLLSKHAITGPCSLTLAQVLEHLRDEQIRRQDAQQCGGDEVHSASKHPKSSCVNTQHVRDLAFNCGSPNADLYMNGEFCPGVDDDGMEFELEPNTRLESCTNIPATTGTQETLAAVSTLEVATAIVPASEPSELAVHCRAPLISPPMPSAAEGANCCETPVPQVASPRSRNTSSRQPTTKLSVDKNFFAGAAKTSRCLQVPSSAAPRTACAASSSRTHPAPVSSCRNSSSKKVGSNIWRPYDPFKIKSSAATSLRKFISSATGIPPGSRLKAIRGSQAAQIVFPIMPLSSMPSIDLIQAVSVNIASPSETTADSRKPQPSTRTRSSSSSNALPESTISITSPLPSLQVGSGALRNTVSKLWNPSCCVPSPMSSYQSSPVGEIQLITSSPPIRPGRPGRPAEAAHMITPNDQDVEMTPASPSCSSLAPSQDAACMSPTALNDSHIAGVNGLSKSFTTAAAQSPTQILATSDHESDELQGAETVVASIASSSQLDKGNSLPTVVSLVRGQQRVGAASATTATEKLSLSTTQRPRPGLSQAVLKAMSSDLAPTADLKQGKANGLSTAGSYLASIHNSSAPLSWSTADFDDDLVIIDSSATASTAQQKTEPTSSTITTTSCTLTAQSSSSPPRPPFTPCPASAATTQPPLITPATTVVDKLEPLSSVSSAFPGRKKLQGDNLLQAHSRKRAYPGEANISSKLEQKKVCLSIADGKSTITISGLSDLAETISQLKAAGVTSLNLDARNILSDIGNSGHSTSVKPKLLKSKRKRNREKRKAGQTQA